MTIVERGTTWPTGLVEREEALAALRGAHAEVRASGGRFVLVSGEAGIGKTSLVRSFCDGVQGARVLSGACDPLFVPRPLGPFLDVAAQVGNGFAEQIRAASGSHDVLVAVHEELDTNQTVLVLEDVHWADEATLDVVRLLARRLADTDLLMIATYRDDALERTHPLHLLLGELASVRRVERIRLEPLSLDGVTRLAEGASVDAERLHAVTSGNPFFVSEVLATGDDEIPETVRAAVLARAASLDESAMALLETVAVAQTFLDTRTVEQIADSRSVGECLQAGVLVPVDGGIAFRHELARIVVEEGLAPTRRRELHRRLLAASEREGEGEPDATRLAHHAEEAGDTAAVLRYAPEAGRRAAAAGAYREAAAQYARALRSSVDLKPGDRAELLEAQARACYLADDQTEAIEVIREAIECRRLQAAPLQEARARTELTDYLWCRGYNGEADENVVRAGELSAGLPEQREHAYVFHTHALSRLYAGDIEESLAFAARAQEIGERFGDTTIAGHARVTTAGATTRRDFETGLRMLRDAVDTAHLQGEHEVAARGLNALVSRPAAIHRHDLVERAIDEALEYCAEYTQDLWRINILAIAARWALRRGRWDDAARYAAQVIDDPRESPWTHHEALCVLALVRARRGDPGAREALAAAEAVGVPSEEAFAHVDLAAAHAEVAWLEHSEEGVLEATDGMLAELQETGDAGGVCRLLFWRGLAGLEAQAPAGATGTYALAVAGRWVEAADEWERQGSPYESALARSRSADLADVRRAHAELQRLDARPLATMIARALREQGVRDLPRGPRASTKANEAELTARELEVLGLVAEGLRNADIAERLVVSRKTVDHHVSAILRKLGVPSRGKAVIEAQRRGVLT